VNNVRRKVAFTGDRETLLKRREASARSVRFATEVVIREFSQVENGGRGYLKLEGQYLLYEPLNRAHRLEYIDHIHIADRKRRPRRGPHVRRLGGWYIMFDPGRSGYRPKTDFIIGLLALQVPLLGILFALSRDENC
jgi:hypothetical protein